MSDYFTRNPLVDLPRAAKGQWLNSRTFLLELNLVGGINHYEFRLTFSENEQSFKGSVTGRTGLTDEQFEGIQSR